MKALEDEPQLTLEACQGSATAFEALVMFYEPRIRRMLYSLTQDLCQETFLAAYRALPRMDGEELHFAPCLYRIARNQLRSEWRRRRHITLTPFASQEGHGDERLDEPSEGCVVRDEVFEERVVQRDLSRRAMAQLPKASVMCLLLDYEARSGGTVML